MKYDLILALSSQIFEHLRETFRRHAFEYEFLLHGGQYDTKYGVCDIRVAVPCGIHSGQAAVGR